MDETSRIYQQSQGLDREVVVDLTGDVDVLTGGRLRERLGQAMGPRGTIVVIDASSVTSLAGANLRELLSADSRLAASGRTLLVRCAPSPVATFLEHAGLRVSTDNALAA